MKNRMNGFVFSGLLFLAFAVLTVLVTKVDVGQIGPRQSEVGLATINMYMFEKLGVNLVWYTITDWIGVLAILEASVFAIVGLWQFIRRKSLFRVDGDILLLGAFYLVVVAAYVFFEILVINYRPVILLKNLEASFPSTHTLIVLCIMGTGMIQFNRRIQHQGVLLMARILSSGIIVVTIAGRLISGVHWFTDIIAGVVLATALVMLYYSFIDAIDRREEQIVKDL